MHNTFSVGRIACGRQNSIIKIWITTSKRLILYIIKQETITVYATNL